MTTHGSITGKTARVNPCIHCDTITSSCYISLTHSTLAISWNFKILSWRTGMYLNMLRSETIHRILISVILLISSLAHCIFVKILRKESIWRVYLIRHILATPCREKGYTGIKINLISLCVIIFYAIFCFVSFFVIHQTVV